MLYTESMRGPEILIPLLAIGFPLLIAMISILTSHQRKMAEFFALQGQNQSNNNDHEVQALRQEVRELKQLLHQQAITLDTLASGRPSMPMSTVADRLNGGNN